MMTDNTNKSYLTSKHIGNQLYDMVMMQYAAGTLSEAHHIMIQSHLTLRPEQGNVLKYYETIGGELMNELNADMAPDALDTVLSRLNEKDAPKKPQPINDACNIYPQALVNYCGWTAKSTPWKKLLPGVECATPEGQKAQLLKVAPGVAMPEHDHSDIEYTLLLDGSYRDESGHYTRGDLVIMDDHMEHKPIADLKTGCICLILNEKPPKFTGFFGSVLNLLNR